MNIRSNAESSTTATAQTSYRHRRMSMKIQSRTQKKRFSLLLFKLRPNPVNWDAAFNQGRIQEGAIAPPKTYESSFFHNDFLQFGKQYSRYKTILPSIVLSQRYTSSALQ